jgi:hypothetical protein
MYIYIYIYIHIHIYIHIYIYILVSFIVIPAGEGHDAVAVLLAIEPLALVGIAVVELDERELPVSLRHAQKARERAWTLAEVDECFSELVFSGACETQTQSCNSDP